MKAGTPGVIANVLTTEAITEKRFVTHDGKHTAQAKSLGVSVYDADSGVTIGVVVTGVMPVIAGAALATVGAPVTSDASGKAIAATAFSLTEGAPNVIVPGSPINGYVCTVAAADGDEILVHLV